MVIHADHHGDEHNRVVKEVKFDARVLRAAKPREILVRMLQNLRSVYAERNDMPRALSAVDRLLLLSPENIRGLPFTTRDLSLGPATRPPDESRRHGE